MTATHEEGLRETFRNDGLLILRDFFGSQEPFKHAEELLYNALVTGEVTRTDRFVSGKLGDFFLDIPCDPRILGLIQHLLESSDVALYLNRLLMKDSKWSDEVGAHQDTPYFHGSDRKISIFVPWSPMQARDGNGGLVFFRRSHKYGRMTRGRILTEQFDDIEVVEENFQPSDLIVMDFNIWHYSNAATTPSPRIIQQVVFQSSSDGSFAGPSLGTPQPKLLSGTWLTSHFSSLASVLPD